MWTDERIAALKEFWAAGHSASEIAAKLGGISRNAVIGKAHRLGLEARPSPIKARPAGADTWGGRTCVWPLGDPAQAGFRFCGDKAEHGRPYCTQHCAVAYRKRDRDRDAA